MRTPHGAFEISRGLVAMPDEVGEALGWQSIDLEADAHAMSRRSPAPEVVAANRVLERSAG